MSSAKAVTDASFEADVLKSDKTILVDFWAEWCGPCRAVSPILDQIAAEHADKIEIVKLNVDDNPQTAMQYQITSIPAMKVYKGGQVVKTVIGAIPDRTVDSALPTKPLLRRAVDELDVDALVRDLDDPDQLQSAVRSAILQAAQDQILDRLRP